VSNERVGSRTLSGNKFQVIGPATEPYDRTSNAGDEVRTAGGSHLGVGGKLLDGSVLAFQ